MQYVIIIKNKDHIIQNFIMATQTNLYMLDPRNHIISIGGSWEEFSAENGGKNTSLKDIYGRPLVDFVTGDTTRMWLETIFQFARIMGKTVERSYRCDSPELKRFMLMRVIPEFGGVLRIEHDILSTEKRAVPIHIQYGRVASTDATKRCSICGRVNIDEWMEPHMKHTGPSGQISVTYTVCDDCEHSINNTA